MGNLHETSGRKRVPEYGIQAYLHVPIITLIDLFKSLFQPRQSWLPAALHPANGRKGQTVDLSQEGLALGRRWHVRGCCLRARSGGHAGRGARSEERRVGRERISCGSRE